MANKHIHAELAADEYAALLRASQKVSLSTSEAVREATIAWVRNTFSDSSGIVTILDKAATTERPALPTVEASVVDARPEYMRPPQRRA